MQINIDWPSFQRTLLPLLLLVLLLKLSMFVAGQPPEALFVAAIDILAAKCDKLLESL